MRPFAALVLACLAAGCAVTPQQTIEAGPRSEHPLRGTPAVAAGCVAGKAQDLGANASVRTSSPSGDQEVVVGMPTSLTMQSLFVVQVTARGKDSQAALYGGGFMLDSARADWARRLTEGC